MMERKSRDWPTVVESIALLAAIVAIIWSMAWMVVNL